MLSVSKNCKIMGCGGKNGRCGIATCGDCDYGAYGPIASGFVLVPNNIDSHVTNFVQKYPTYRTLTVCEDAIENTANGRGGKKCCETGRKGHKGACASGACGTNLCDDFGFVHHPQDIRPNTVTVLGKVKCTCTRGMLDMDGKCRGECYRLNAVEHESLGFKSWPPIGYVKSVRACGPIVTEACCKKHKKRGCGKCRNVAKCDDSSSSSSSSRTSSFSSTSASWSSSSSSTHRHHHHHSGKHHHHHSGKKSSSSSCGCGH